MKDLNKYNLRPLKRLGQHFLRDKSVVSRMVDTIAPKKNDFVLEIGPGQGVLTASLAQSGARIVVVEKDRALVRLLHERLGKHFENLQIIEGDFLNLSWKRFLPKKPALIDIAGNIPYYITSPILFSLVEHHTRIRRAFLTVQKEVADRLLAQPGNRTYGRLTVSMRFFADIERVFNISRSSFSPRPRVDSSFIVLYFRRRFPARLNHSVFLDLIRASFAHRRKNILNTLSMEKFSGLDKKSLRGLLESCGIPPTVRPEELMLKDYMDLAQKAQNVMVNR